MSADLIPFHRIVTTEGLSARDAAALVFDPDWYRAEYADVAVSGVDPARHYFANGASEGRNPNPHFNTRWYETKYPDVKGSGMNPYMHFLLYGFREGRQPRESDVVSSLSSARVVPAKTRRPAGRRMQAGGGL